MKLQLNKLVIASPKGGKILDVGCHGFSVCRLAKNVERADLQHYGVDYCVPENVPEGFIFQKADLNSDKIPFPDDYFDLVVASHIIEHLRDGIGFVEECLRVTKPTGTFYITCPSEKSLRPSGFPFDHHLMFSTSFFDDPTHVGRPYSPQSLDRLARYFSCEPMGCGYYKSWKAVLLSPILIPVARCFRIGWLYERTTWMALGWSSYIAMRKPNSISGKPPFNYFIPEERMGGSFRFLQKIKRTFASRKRPI
jgi:SAM-dependent methyltransferase